MLRVTLRVVNDDERVADPSGVTGAAESASGVRESRSGPVAIPTAAEGPAVEAPTRLRQVVSGRAHRPWLGRLTLRKQLVAIGAAGIILTLVVVQSALWGLGTVNREHRTLDLIRQAQQYHQDADMQHDALHADVYRALATSGGQVALSRQEVLADVASNADRFERDVDGARALSASASAGSPEERTRIGTVGSALDAVRAKELAYLAVAKQLAERAFTNRGAALAALGPFEQLFRELEGALADTTNQLAQAADKADEDAHHEIGTAQQRILGASGAALAGLLVMAFMLSRVGKRLAEALTEVEAHVEAVVRSDQHSRDFLAYAAHQLRTPVSATRASAEALLLKGASRGQEQLLSALIQETGRAGRLVTALLRMARLDQGEATPARSCDVVELCRRELERMEARAPGLRWVLKVNQPAPGLVMLSPDATAEALANLLDNARRHANRTVTVRISSTSEVVGISVRDDGSGLPDAARISAFERFVSLDGHGGSGLGLPIARGLAESQDGHLEYERGRFLMTLPARRLEVKSAA